MDKIFEQYSLSELFAYVCPGTILLSSLLFWVDPKFNSSFWQREFVAIFLLLVSSYILGLILASYNRIAEFRYERNKLSKTGKRFGIFTKILDLIFTFAASRKPKVVVKMTTNLKANIYDNIHNLPDRLSAPIDGLSRLCSWEWLQMCRTLLANYTGEKHKAILAEAERLHRRFLFSMGVALALFLVAFQALLRFIIFALGNFWDFLNQWCNTLPNVNPFLLIIIAVLGFWSSSEMRRIADNISYRELYLIANCMPESRLAIEGLDDKYTNKS